LIWAKKDYEAVLFLEKTELTDLSIKFITSKNYNLDNYTLNEMLI